MPLFFLQFFYRLFAAEGIARKHFQWQKTTASLLRKQIAWIRFIAVPGSIFNFQHRCIKVFDA